MTPNIPLGIEINMKVASIELLSAVKRGEIVEFNQTSPSLIGPNECALERYYRERTRR